MASPTLPRVPASLAESRDLTLPMLRQAVSTLHPDLARVAGYHCGLTDRHGRPVTTSEGGKMLRPALVFLAARTTGAAAPAGNVVAGAVAIQLVHEFSLLHDDIMDRDRTRRGRPTAWTVYGTDAALLTGDVLLALAMSVIAGHPLGAAVLAEAVLQLCAGQADDLALGTRSEATVADWERMASGKTGALIAASCRIGALLGGGTNHAATTLETVGGHLGLAFQAVDDWLGIWGERTRTGKPVGADIAARKRSLPITVTLAQSGTVARALAATLATPGDLTADDIAKATAAMDHAHAGEITQEHARRHAARARTGLTSLGVSPVHRDWDELITFLTARTT